MTQENSSSSSAAASRLGDDPVRAIEGLTHATVLVVGDVMLDRFVHGAVDRISPEAPIPVLSVKGRSTVPGGAGNVVCNIAAVGAKSVLVSVTGDDPAADELGGLLENKPGLSLTLIRDTARPTTVKTRFLAGGQQLLRADEETAHALDSETEAALIAAIDMALPRCGAIVLSDYGKGVLTDGVIKAVIDRAHKAGIPVLVDPKGRDYGRYSGADLLTPNRAELSLATGLAMDSDQDVEAACAAAIRDFGTAGILATRSEKGMTLADAESVLHIPAQAREVFDVVGAGDTVIALMASALASGLDKGNAARLANLGGGVVVGKTGTAVARPEELVAAAHGAAWQEGERKVLTLAGMVDQVGLWRLQGKSVGFTNGCFDLLHPGHVHLLQQAREQCDRLVVGLNSDESVSRLKGPERPVHNETARATVLASLASVDAVVVFGEDTPLDLIRALKPDVLVKGQDYTVETVVGAEDVQSWGGKVFLAGLLDGHSTTGTVKKLRGG